MPHRLLIAAAFASAPLAAPAAAQVPPGWAGTYSYDWEGGRTAGGTGITVNYTLTLGANGCHIRAQGWQTDETIRCTAARNGNVIDIRFASYGDGKLVNIYGVARFKPGERLFSLSNRRGAIWTGWGSYSPWEGKAPLGHHFRKTG